ncbi:hypothetical protein N1851_024468 [Merluccius polli]|uniref:Uncharacterized protein n=1 Tax=Merluccius polli TaxID=89951 RepID=A0AA47MF82_MERPO|nr:hypothetical protein N1851_024468 [Merluccius polli]
MVLTYKAINVTAPTYLQELVRPHAPARALRATTSAGRLVPPSLRAGKGRTGKSQLFSVLAPLWWNDLPAGLQSQSPASARDSRPTCSDHGRGGGIAVIHHKKWKVLPLSMPVFSSFEHLAFTLPGPTPTVIATFYHPPKPHILDSINSSTSQHTKGHTLDLICCSGLTPSNCTADDLHVSDHFLISFSTALCLSRIKSSHFISFRNLKNINIDILCSNIDNILIPVCSTTSDEMITHYNISLNNILNSLAPVKTRSVSFSTTAPWYTPHLRSLKTKGRQLERLYKKTGLAIHKEMYITHIRHYKDSITQAKTNHYSAQIISNEGNTKSLFTLLNRTLQSPDFLPPHLYSTDTCNSLMQFFNDNQLRLRQTPFPSPALPLLSPAPLPHCQHFSSFQLPDDLQIYDLIWKSKPSICQLDPLPITLVKSCLPSVLPLICTIIHSSLTTGSVPSSLKTAAITPILKKPGSDPNNYNNLRPISNLPFISKILQT